MSADSIPHMRAPPRHAPTLASCCAPRLAPTRSCSCSSCTEEEAEPTPPPTPATVRTPRNDALEQRCHELINVTVDSGLRLRQLVADISCQHAAADVQLRCSCCAAALSYARCSCGRSVVCCWHTHWRTEHACHSACARPEARSGPKTGRCETRPYMQQLPRRNRLVHTSTLSGPCA